MPERWQKYHKLGRGLLISSLMTGACTPYINKTPTPEIFPTQPRATETLAPTPSPEPTLAPITTLPVEGYPTSDRGFLLGRGGLENAEDRIRELGAGADIEKMEAMYIAELNRQGINPEEYELVFDINEQARNPSWTMMLRTNGQLRLPKITAGPDAGQLVRSCNLFAYLDHEIGDDFFDLVPLQNPAGFPNLEQRPVPDRSGWWPLGGYSKEGQLVGWYSTDTDKWLLATDFLPQGAVAGKFQEGTAVAFNNQGEVGWIYNQEQGEWEEIEKLPTTCLDEEAQKKVVEEFLKVTGYGSMKEELDAFRSSGKFNPELMWGGFDTTSSLDHDFFVQLMGSLRISLSGRPGFNEGDVGLCMLAASPHYPEIIIPLPVGLKKDGKWVQTAYFRINSNSDTFNPNFSKREFSSLEEVETWTKEEGIGKSSRVNIILRYLKPELIMWRADENNPLNPLLENPEGYIWKYSSDPSRLAALGTKLDWSYGGEQVEVGAMEPDLNRKPGGDIGFFATNLWIGTSQSLKP